MSKKKKKGSGSNTIATNRKARHDYELLATYDAGIVLMGSEIKSIRNRQVNLSDGFVSERDGELWLMNVHIAPYEPAKNFGHTEPKRPRKLLLHRREINQILDRIREMSFTAIPLRLYLDHGLAKVEIAVARGKKRYDKRADIAKRVANRQIERALKDL